MDHEAPPEHTACGSFLRAGLDAICLLGTGLLVRVPRRQPLAAITTLAIVAAVRARRLGFHDIYQFPFGSQFAVVPGPDGTVKLIQAQAS